MAARYNNMAAGGSLFELSYFLVILLFFSYVLFPKAYDGTAKDITSIIVVSKADIRSLVHIQAVTRD